MKTIINFGNFIKLIFKRAHIIITIKVIQSFFPAIKILPFSNIYIYISIKKEQEKYPLKTFDSQREKQEEETKALNERNPDFTSFAFIGN